MGLQDRHYYKDRDGPRFGSFLRRIFGSGENPLEWSIPLYRAWGITVKLHILFILIIVGKLFFTASKDTLSAGLLAIGMASLFTLVLLHEYGHCIAARKVGGEADEIMLWPLGGLAMCRPPHHWRAHLITAIGGPLVNVLLIPVFIAALLAAGFSWSQIIGFNPFDPGRVIPTIQASSSTAAYARITLWWAHYMNLILLGFNVLVPMFPMDGGRIAQCLLWRSMGYQRSMLVATTLGLFIAIVLFVLSSVTSNAQLSSLAVFGGIVCFFERQRAKLGGYDEPEPRWINEREMQEDRDREQAARERRRQEAIDEQAELDRLLAKIKESGMGSLTSREKAWLERQSQARREQ